MIQQAIVVVGLARTGKDTAADYLVERYGFFRVTLSELIEKEIAKRGIPNSKMNQARVGDMLRKEKGMDVVARMALKEVKKQHKVVFVGARSVEEVELLRKNSRKLVVLKLEAEMAQRKGRNEGISPADRKMLAERDAIDIREKGLGKVLETADYTVTNNDTREKLYRQLDHLMGNI